MAANVDNDYDCDDSSEYIRELNSSDLDNGSDIDSITPIQKYTPLETLNLL